MPLDSADAYHEAVFDSVNDISFEPTPFMADHYCCGRPINVDHVIDGLSFQNLRTAFIMAHSKCVPRCSFLSSITVCFAN